MKVLIVNPPPYEIIEPRYDQPEFPRAALACLAAYLREREVDVHVLDCKFDRLNSDDTREFIRKLRPDVVGCTALTNEIMQAAIIATLTKEIDPKIKTIIGGNHLSFLSERTLREFPQFNFGPITRGLLEPDAGVIMARRAVQMVVRQAVKQSVDYRITAVTAPTGTGAIGGLSASDGSRLTAGTYVFACGPWLAKLFPSVVGGRRQSTRQEVFFLGAEPGTQRFVPPHMPAWIDVVGGVYGVPDLEGRGFKIGLHHHGPPFDPDTGERIVSDGALQLARMILAKRVPSLAQAPLLEARVCQYTNSGTGDFLIDQHPDHDNVWLVGAGSGHGFKHGPAVGEYVAAQLSGRGSPEPRFTLNAHRPGQERRIY